LAFGDVVLENRSDYELTSSQTCNGVGTFGDVLLGTPVVLTDGSGATLARGGLDQGFIYGDECDFRFQLFGVPAGRTEYLLAIGSRIARTYSEDALKAGPRLTLDSA
jgi:hypothetical protein